jgi:autotransporter-associated beta strand protein
MRARTQTFKGCQLHSSPFGLILVLAGASLLPAALAPRANAGSTDYWDFDYPPGSHSRPAPELLSQPQGVLVNQQLASNYNSNLALNVAPGGQPGGFQPQQVDANFSWTGAANTTWNNAGNWSPSGPPSGDDTALFNSAFSNQPDLIADAAIGTLLMTNSVAQDVTISSSLAAILTIAGNGIPGTGILIDSGSPFTLTITARVGIDASQAWTNNSGNLFTVGGATLALGEQNILTVNGSGNTLISAAINDGGLGSGIVKDGSGTLTITASNTYSGGTTVNSGTLLVNGRGDLGTGNVTVNNSGTIGGDSTSALISRGSFDDARDRLTVSAGGNLAPGNGGNNTAVITLHALTLEPASNFRIDINGTSPGTGYDRLVLTGAGNNRYVITNSNLLVSVGTTLSVGQTFLIGLRTAGGSIRGEFAQGNSVVGSDGTVFSISYIGGDGNDIVLTVAAAPVPEPSTWVGGVLAIAGLAFTQRRRLRKLIARRCAVGS